MPYSNYYTSSRLFHGSISHVMGTRLDCLMVGGNPHQLALLWQKIADEVRRLDCVLSRYDSSGELYKVNCLASHYPIVLSDTLWDALSLCGDYYKRTDGLFDVTLGNFRHVLLDEEKHSVFLFAETARFDLGGFGKGYALRIVHDLLKDEGVTQALVNFGNSSVLALGHHPMGDYWPIGLDDPLTRQSLCQLKLTDRSMSVSGNTSAHPRHIVHPLTGRYVEGRRLVSVVSVDPLEAEVLTTTLMIADEVQARRIVPRFNIDEKYLYNI